MNERQDSTLDSRELARKAAHAALTKKAVDLVVLDLGGLTIIADFFIICSGESTTQVRAIADHIEREFADSGVRPRGIEGLDYGHWVLVDYGDIIVHVFEKETREYYALEKLWMDAPLVAVDEDTPDLVRQDKRAVHR